MKISIEDARRLIKASFWWDRYLVQDRGRELVAQGVIDIDRETYQRSLNIVTAEVGVLVREIFTEYRSLNYTPEQRAAREVIPGSAIPSPPPPKKRRLSKENAEKIIDAACIKWKYRLARRWGMGILTLGSVIITEELYQEMRKECTPQQHELFDEIFGKDTIDTETKLSIRAGNLFLGASTSSFGPIQDRAMGNCQEGLYLPSTEGMEYYVEKDNLGFQVLMLRKK